MHTLINYSEKISSLLNVFIKFRNSLGYLVIYYSIFAKAMF